ncbi:hypothetical protein OROMI_005585 [Orobanche minor]
MATHSLNLSGVLSGTKRIINAHSRHFLALSVIFLLPLSFSLIVYPSFVPSPSSLSHYHQTLFFFSSPNDEIPPIAKSDLVLAALYWFFVLLLSLCATSSITYSTFHGFYGRPVEFISSIKSILFALLPLISTLITSQTIIPVLTEFLKTKLPKEMIDFIHGSIANYGKIRLVLKKNKYFMESPFPQMLTRLLKDEVIGRARVSSEGIHEGDGFTTGKSAGE